MMNKWNFYVMLLGMVACGTAHAADAANDCRLRGGDVVPLPAAACVREGGTVVKPGEAAASAPAAVKLSADPALAAAQRAIVDVLGQAVVDIYSHARVPEGVDRTLKFDGCTMTVDENLHLDYGNLVAQRLDIHMVSEVDFRKLAEKGIKLVGEVESKGGYFKPQAVSIAAKSGRDDKPLSVSVMLKDDDGKYGRLTTPGLAPYWDAPREYLWLKDGYGYVVVDDQGYADTSQIKMLYMTGSKADAASLAKAFGQMRAACQAGK